MADIRTLRKAVLFCEGDAVGGPTLSRTRKGFPRPRLHDIYGYSSTIFNPSDIPVPEK